VAAPDLPGHEPMTLLSPVEITFDRYVQFVQNLVNTITGNVILVGHSFGGAVIEKVIDELDSSKVLKAFFVSGFIPKDGENAGELLRADVGSRLMESFRINKDAMTVELILDKIGETIYNGCEEADIEYAKLNVVPQSVIPIGTPMRIQSKKQIKRVGILCRHDKALTPETQERMYKNAGCEIRYLDSGHAPFFSHADELAELLVE